MDLVSNFQPHNRFLFPVPQYYCSLHKKKHAFLVHTVMKSAISNGEICNDQGFFSTCCYCESHYLRSNDKAFLDLLARV